MSDTLDRSRTIAISALNEAHERHGYKKIMDCNFCTSLAAEMTIARHYEPVFARAEKYEQENKDLTKQLADSKAECDRLRSRAAMLEEAYRDANKLR